MVCESNNPKIPYFNAPIYLENKTAIGKVDEILGPINQVFFTIKPQEGIVATSFKSGDKFYIGGDKLLPLEKFLPKPKPPPGSSFRGASGIILTALQAQQNLREQVVLQGEVQQGEVEVEIEELAEGHLGVGELSVTEGVEGEEEAEAVLWEAVQAHEVAIPTSRDPQVALEVVDHNNYARRYGARGKALQ
ncbi:MAG: hypothetical protein Q9191_001734 [Dirinaria sp. TL-2023a]